MNLSLKALTLFTCVAAVPASPSAVLTNVGRRLFDPSQGEMALSHDESVNARFRRGAELDMCSYRMRNITKLARVAGEIFMSVDDSPLYRRARNHVSYVNLEQPGRYRSKTSLLYHLYIISYHYNFCFAQRLTPGYTFSS